MARGKIRYGFGCIFKTLATTREREPPEPRTDVTRFALQKPPSAATWTIDRGRGGQLGQAAAGCRFPPQRSGPKAPGARFTATEREGGYPACRKDSVGFWLGRGFARTGGVQAANCRAEVPSARERELCGPQAEPLPPQALLGSVAGLAQLPCRPAGIADTCPLSPITRQQAVTVRGKGLRGWVGVGKGGHGGTCKSVNNKNRGK